MLQFPWAIGMMSKKALHQRTSDVTASRDFFVRILRSIVLVSISLLAVLSVSLYIAFRNQSIDQMHRYSLSLLEDTRRQIEATSRSLTFYVDSVFQHISTKRLMFDRYDRLNELVADIDAIRAIRSSNPQVHSVYIYNSYSDVFWIIGPATARRVTSTFDPAGRELLKRDSQLANRPIPRSIPFSTLDTETRTHVYSYVRRSGIAVDGFPESGVVVNVLADWFYGSAVASSHSAQLGTIVIVDREGTIVGTGDHDAFLQPYGSPDIIRRALENPVRNDYFRASIDGGDFLVSFVESAELNWTLLNIIPYSIVTEPLARVVIYSTAIIIVLLLLSIVVAYLVSKRIYAPVERLRIAVDRDELVDETAFPRIAEFRSIADRYHQMSEEVDALQDYKDRSRATERAHLLKSILFNTAPDKEEVRKQIAELDLRIDMDRPTLLILTSVDDYKQVFSRNLSKRDEQLFKLVISTITDEELAGETVRCESVDLGAEGNATVLSLSDFDQRRIVESLTGKLKNVHEKVFQSLSISVSSFIGRMADSLLTVGDQYAELVELSRQRIVYGQGCILDLDTHGSLPREHEPVPDGEYAAFLESLRMSKFEGANEQCRAIITKAKTTDYDTFFSTATYLCSLMKFHVANIEKNAGMEFDVDFVDANRTILECETASQVERVFADIIHTIEQTTGHIREDAGNLYVDRINAMIDEKFMSENLYSGEIAEELGLSQSYVNRIYRNHCGTSIASQIKKVRLEKAADLLSTTNYPVDTVIQSVGWTTKEYFYSSFKSRFGVTPGDYRHLRRKEELRQQASAHAAHGEADR